MLFVARRHVVVFICLIFFFLVFPKRNKKVLGKNHDRNYPEIYPPPDPLMDSTTMEDTSRCSSSPGEKKEPDWIPLSPDGTPSRRKVWVPENDDDFCNDETRPRVLWPISSTDDKEHEEEVVDTSKNKEETLVASPATSGGSSSNASEDSNENTARHSSSSAKDLRNQIQVIQDLDNLVPLVQDSDYADQVEHKAAKAKNLRNSTWQGHIQPHVENIQTVIDGKYQRHFQPRVQQAQEQWEKFSTATHSWMEDQVKPSIQHVQRGTLQSFENVQRVTLTGYATSKQFVLDFPRNSKRIWQEEVLPAVDQPKRRIQSKIKQIQTGSHQKYQQHVEPHVHRVKSFHLQYQHCYMGRAPQLFPVSEISSSPPWIILSEAALRAYGKVIFCDNPVTGALIWCAMFVGSPMVAFNSMACVISTNYIAAFLNVASFTELRKGDLGINAVLVGAGASAFFQFEDPFLGWLGSFIMATVLLPPITLLTYLHCARSSIFQSRIQEDEEEGSSAMPILLIPYNLVMIAFLVMALLWERALVVPAVDMADMSSSTRDVTTMSLMLGVFHGVSKIFLVQGVFSGILIVVGACMCSRILAMALLWGSLVSTLWGWWFAMMPAAALNAGTAGYNAALTTTAMAYFFVPSWSLVAVGFLVIALSGLLEAVVAMFFWDALGLPITLTAGFCLATLAILMLDSEESCSRLGVLRRIEHPMTPEEFLAVRRSQNQHPMSTEEDDPPSLAPADSDTIDEEQGLFENYTKREQNKEKMEEDETPSETTPLIS